MIINKPNPKVFEKQSVQYLMQGINLIYEKERDNAEAYGEDFDNTNFWNYHQGILSNSLMLLFQSLENFLKSQVCKISPFLLIAAEPKKWGSSKQNIDFNDLFMHPFDDLLVIYLELGLGSISDQTATKLEELRKKRNQVTHGVLTSRLTTDYVMNIFYVLVRHIWGPKVWWDQIKDHIFNEPLFGMYDTDVEKAYLNLYVEFFVKYFGFKRTGEIFGVDLKQRRYYCPYCHYWLNKEVDVADAVYAILVPNKPTSTNLYCMVCDQNHTVTRQSCVHADCKGNVISDDGQCLTCFSDQSEE